MRWLALAASLFVFAPLAAGQAARAQTPQAATITGTLSPAPSRAGEAARLVITAHIASGWHLYSLVPTPPPGPSPTAIAVSAERGVAQAGAATEDAPVVQLDPNFGKQVAFHERNAVFTVPLQIAASVKPGSYPVTARITYQTCNASECLPPRTQVLSVSLRVDAGPPRAQFLFAGTPTQGGPPAGRLWPFLVAAFLAGLLALLTPCVFPLIPVTFGYFTKEAHGNQHRLVGLASAYAIGLILSFAGLGFVMAITLGAAGANRAAANPWINLFFGVLFVVFAFGFFEAIPLRLPAGLSQLASPLKRSGGVVGVLFMGLAFVFAAFTCTVPFIGTVLVAAASAQEARAWLRPLAGMLAFALALALPFFLLALFPKLLVRLPKSGGWMTRFKAVLGFVELAYALLYFSKADLVWQAAILTRPVIFALWALIAVGGMLYLLGLLRVNAYPDEGGKVSLGRFLGAAAFGAWALYCLYAATGRPINGWLAAYLPTSDYGPASAVKAGQTMAQDGDGLTWLGSYSTALAQARRQNRPIFVDFTGYTCTNCRYNEISIFPQPEIKSSLTRYILVRLYTDGGAHAQDNQAFEQQHFGTVALPLYAEIGPDGQTIGRQAGTITEAGGFAAFLARGLQVSPPAAPVSPPGALWAAYSAGAVGSAQRQGRPVIIDFTASWCTVCHQIERTVFAAPQVAPSLNRFTTLRADLTKYSSPPSAALEKQYHIVALPVVLFLDAQGREIPGTRVTGLVSAQDFAARMTKADPSATVAAAQSP